jgi:hypothetical protein
VLSNLKENRIVKMGSCGAKLMNKFGKLNLVFLGFVGAITIELYIILIY